jgi:hypothetical protein
MKRSKEEYQTTCSSSIDCGVGRIKPNRKMWEMLPEGGVEEKREKNVQQRKNNNTHSRDKPCKEGASRLENKSCRILEWGAGEEDNCGDAGSTYSGILCTRPASSLDATSSHAGAGLPG